MLCSLCARAECCRETFREVATSLRFEYILGEYSSLYDAWRVYQGVALYREYRGQCSSLLIYIQIFKVNILDEHLR